MSLPIKDAGVARRCAYLCPCLTRQVDVGGEFAIYRFVFLCGFVPCQQAVGVIDHVTAVVLYRIAQILSLATLSLAGLPATDGAVLQILIIKF